MASLLMRQVCERPVPGGESARVVPSGCASRRHCLGSGSVLCPGNSQGLVPPASVPSSASRRLFSVEAADGLWFACPSARHDPARCVAVRGLAADISKLGMQRHESSCETICRRPC